MLDDKINTTAESVQDVYTYNSAGGSDRMLQEALDLAKLRLAVFPCRGKDPAIKGGNGCKDASTDPKTIRQMWHREPGSNIGIATGQKSGLWALDIDPGKGANEALAELEAQHGKLPDTVVSVTGSGGRHLFFLYHGERIFNRNSDIGPGIDVKAEGGYVIAAPSIHPDTGKAYEWADGILPDRDSIANAPEWLMDLVTGDNKAQRERKQAQPPQRVGKPVSNGSGYYQAALDGECQAVAKMTKGGRNGRLNVAAMKLGGYVAAGHLDRKVVERALFDAAVACGHVADDGENVARGTINSGLTAGIAAGAKSAPEREPKTERQTKTVLGNSATQEPAAAAIKADVQDDGGPFVVTESGVFYRYSKDGEDMLDKICSRLDVIAVTHDESGNGWGRVMQFQDLAGSLHEWAMPMSLAAGDGSEIRAELLDQGLRIEPFKHAGQRVIQYITSSTPADTWLSVTRPGWHGDFFIMPGETFGNGEKRAVLQRERSFKHNFKVQGTLEEWQKNIARLCVGNAYLAFGVSSAFAAPLLNLTHEQGGGFHFRGGSSCGKSTTLEVAGSVMGGGGQNGYLTSWRATDNGLEGVGESHCDALLCIDEIGQADPRTLGQTAYMLANGQGKIRASKSGSARALAEWRLLFLSNGEESLASRMNEAGAKAHAGMEVRLADIPVCGKWGVIDKLHEFPESRDLINHLKKAARRFYGSPIREYLRRLVLLDREAVAKEVVACQIEFQRDHVPPGSGEQVERVAKRFALAAAGGELATDMGITGWETGEAMKAAAKCFKAWLGARGTIGNTEDISAIDQVRTFLEVHGASRFSYMDEKDNGVEDHLVINRAGYKRKTKDGRTEYLLFRNVFRNEVCKGFDFQNVETLLIDRGFLAVDSSGKHQITARRSAGYRDEAGNLVTDKSGQPRTVDRFYCVLPTIFTGS